MLSVVNKLPTNPHKLMLSCCSGLFYSLHGSPLLDAGLVTLNPALSTHPTLVCLDLGDCMLGDEALGLICGMLPPDGAKSGNDDVHFS